MGLQCPRRQWLLVHEPPRLAFLRNPGLAFSVCGRSGPTSSVSLLRPPSAAHYFEAITIATCCPRRSPQRRIRVVLDNLSTHSAGALYQAFPADEARRVLRRLEFHYVPKHASFRPGLCTGKVAGEVVEPPDCLQQRPLGTSSLLRQVRVSCIELCICRCADEIGLDRR
jgi:hypothetical protein